MRDAYQTRHTYATLALMAGVNPAYIARQLGHANMAMLFKHYSKWIDGADAGREKSKLNKVFGPNLDRELLDFCDDVRRDGAKPLERLAKRLVTPTGLEPVFSP